MLTDEELRAIQGRMLELGVMAIILEGQLHSDDVGAIKRAVEDIGSLSMEVRRLQGELARYKWTRISEGLPEKQGKYLVECYEVSQGTWQEVAWFFPSLGWADAIRRWTHVPPMEGE